MNVKRKKCERGNGCHNMKPFSALLFVAMLLLSIIPIASAPGWNYRRQITITNTGSTLTDYQVLVTLNTSIMGSPYCNISDDGSDLRFTNEANTIKYDYWIESWNNSGTSKIWVKVSSIQNGDSTMYMYYGNSEASSESNRDATFVSSSFTDTFTDSSKINAIDSCNISVTGEHVQIGTYSSSTTLYSAGDNRIVKQAADANYGTADFIALQVYNHQGHCQRALITFNLASIPFAATINNATLKSKVYYYVISPGGPGGRTVYAYRLTNSWTETGSTWNKRNGTSNWVTAGGDYTTSGGASSTVPSEGDWQQWNVVTIVQAWVNGTFNYGFLLKDSNEAYTTNTCWLYYSRESSDDPELHINYTANYTTATLRSVLLPEDTDTRLAVGTELSWNDTEPTNTDVKYQIEYKADGSWELVPDSVLSGSSAGFDTSPVNISSVKTEYGQIRLKGSLSTTDVSTTPTVHDWTVTYYYRNYTDPEPTTSVGDEWHHIPDQPVPELPPLVLLSVGLLVLVGYVLLRRHTELKRGL